MGGIGTLLTVVGAIAVGVGSFLYNDGHDHEIAGLIGAGLGWLGGIFAGVAQQDAAEARSYNCAVNQRDCPDHSGGLLPSLWRTVWDGFLQGIAVELLLIGFCGVIGMLVAKSTRRKANDGRRLSVLPPD